MTSRVLVGLLACNLVLIACRNIASPPDLAPVGWSGWIEDRAVHRGHITAGDFAQFGCPPGWVGVEDTAAALRGRQVSTVYMGTDAPPREGTLTCVAQKDFALPPRYPSNTSGQTSPRQPLSPVWVEVDADSTTIGFRSELPAGAAIYVARETPCGPRVIGVRLGDLLTWLVDPHAATKRDFLGMVSAGCPGPRR